MLPQRSTQRSSSFLAFSTNSALTPSTSLAMSLSSLSRASFWHFIANCLSCSTIRRGTAVSQKYAPLIFNIGHRGCSGSAQMVLMIGRQGGSLPRRCYRGTEDLEKRWGRLRRMNLESLKGFFGQIGVELAELCYLSSVVFQNRSDIFVLHVDCLVQRRVAEHFFHGFDVVLKGSLRVPSQLSCDLLGGPRQYAERLSRRLYVHLAYLLNIFDVSKHCRSSIFCPVAELSGPLRLLRFTHCAASRWGNTAFPGRVLRIIRVTHANHGCGLGMAQRSHKIVYYSRTSFGSSLEPQRSHGGHL